MSEFYGKCSEFLITVCDIQRRQQLLPLEENRQFDLLNERIERLSIRGGTATTTSMQQQMLQHAKARLTTTSSVEQVIMCLPPGRANSEPNNNSKSCHSCCHMQQQEQHRKDATAADPVYAVVDLQHKYAQRKLRSSGNLQPKRCNSYDSIMHYSVCLDMPLKESQKRTSLAEPDVDGIYEDGDQLIGSIAQLNLSQKQQQQAEAAAQQQHDDADDDENIYEPINICASYGQPSTHAIWRYLSRIKLKPSLRRLSARRTKQQQQQQSALYESIKLPTVPAAAAASSTNAANGMLVSTSRSHLASIRHKFGLQRKSLRARMHKLCQRSGAPAAPTTGSQTAAAGKQLCPRWRTIKSRAKCAAPLEQDNKRKLSKRFFSGSLPLLRNSNALARSRISFFEKQKQKQKQSLPPQPHQPATAQPIEGAT